MSQQVQLLILLSVATPATAFGAFVILEYRRNNRLLKHQRSFYLGKPRKQKQSFWQPLFLYRRRWSRMRTLLPKLPA